MAANCYRPKTLDEVVALAGLPSLRRMDAVSAFTVLIGMDVLRPARRSPADVVERSAAYNRHVLERALVGPYLQPMAAPAIGAGILCSRPAQLYLKAWLDGERDAASLAAGASAVFEIAQERAVRNEEMTTPEDNLAVLAEMAEALIIRSIPLYQRSACSPEMRPLR